MSASTISLPASRQHSQHQRSPRKRPLMVRFTAPVLALPPAGEAQLCGRPFYHPRVGDGWAPSLVGSGLRIERVECKRTQVHMGTAHGVTIHILCLPITPVPERKLDYIRRGLWGANAIDIADAYVVLSIDGISRLLEAAVSEALSRPRSLPPFPQPGSARTASSSSKATAIKATTEFTLFIFNSSLGLFVYSFLPRGVRLATPLTTDRRMSARLLMNESAP